MNLDPARAAAFEALQAVTLDGAYANLAIADVLRQRGLGTRDAAFATELLYGTCRGLGTYDWVIEAASGRTLDTLEAEIVDILRLSSHQLLGMRVPAHAAVASSVELARQAVGERATGVTNAICRKIAARDRDGWFAFLGEGLDERARLVLETMHPGWIVDAFAAVLPADELRVALEADNASPLTTLVVRPGLARRDDLPGQPTRMSPYGSCISGAPGTVHLVRSGKAGVQDEGSQLVALALARADAPAGPWLDMCAGPGGKASLLAGLALQRGTRLLASEVSAHRAGLVRNALRTYPGLPQVIVADGRAPAWPAASFARVMVDVPCTGLGSLRRRPESRWRHVKSDVVDLGPLQRELLCTALDSAVPSGVVAYATCSPHPDETEAVVASVLAGRDDVEVLDTPALLPEVPEARRGPDGRYLQLWPHRHGTDAMFCALLRRR